jgi:hypothetical protein
MEVYARFMKNSVVFTDKGEIKKKAQYNFKSGANMDMIVERHAAVANKKYKMKEIHPTLRGQFSKLSRTLDLLRIEMALVSATSLKKVVLKSHEAGVSCDSQTMVPILNKMINDIDEEMEELKNKNKKLAAEHKAAKRAAAAEAAAAAAEAAAAADSWEDMADEEPVAVDAEPRLVAEAEADTETEVDTDSDAETETESWENMGGNDVDADTVPDVEPENDKKVEYVVCADGFVHRAGMTRWSDSDSDY